MHSSKPILPSQSTLRSHTSNTCQSSQPSLFRKSSRPSLFRKSSRPIMSRRPGRSSPFSQPSQYNLSMVRVRAA